MATCFRVKHVTLADKTEPKTTAIDRGFFWCQTIRPGQGAEALFTEDKDAFLESKFVKQPAVTEPESARLNGQRKESGESPNR
jgi:hypothetical protein